MRVIGAEMMSREQVVDAVKRGGRFFRYYVVISGIVATRKEVSDIYFIQPGERSVKKGLKYSLLSALFGWWGIPYGPIYTVAAITTNLRGGIDVTEYVLKGLFPESDKAGLMQEKVICPHCWTELTLDDNEREKRAFGCDKCKKYIDYSR